MRSFGEDLRSEREARGITLEDISASSRIPVPVLEAIERDEFDRLPGGLFNVSFVRQYASAVGLNQDEVVDAFAKACATSSGDPDHPPLLSRLSLWKVKIEGKWRRGLLKA